MEYHGRLYPFCVSATSIELLRARNNALLEFKRIGNEPAVGSESDPTANQEAHLTITYFLCEPSCLYDSYTQIQERLKVDMMDWMATKEVYLTFIPVGKSTSRVFLRNPDSSLSSLLELQKEVERLLKSYNCTPYPGFQPYLSLYKRVDDKPLPDGYADVVNQLAAANWHEVIPLKKAELHVTCKDEYHVPNRY